MYIAIVGADRYLPVAHRAFTTLREIHIWCSGVNPTSVVRVFVHDLEGGVSTKCRLTVTFKRLPIWLSRTLRHCEQPYLVQSAAAFALILLVCVAICNGSVKFASVNHGQHSLVHK